MDLLPPTPLNEPEAICTGSVRIVANPGPYTLRLTVQRPEGELSFALCEDECSQLVALLIRYVATRK
ncbi:hypothetical protein [Bradyrhizobium sp. th.b2]|uniref:hypothetical protein n=1 Tax=Bradyrhizobium sp. th-b2 TaxID=172088 RepID=UPI0003F712BC|nr:hypothetical protein [Bradyrhizobium sp. th.b2]